MSWLVDSGLTVSFDKSRDSFIREDKLVSRESSIVLAGFGNNDEDFI